MSNTKPIGTPNPFIYINGEALPSPKPGTTLIVSTIVNSGRNANGTVVAEKVGRDLYKVDALEWPWLTPAQWGRILELFDNFFVTARIWDMVHNQWINLKMYPGDRSAKPYWTDDSGVPLHYTECKVNIIDCGEI